jgi:hypothetical protein
LHYLKELGSFGAISGTQKFGCLLAILFARTAHAENVTRALIFTLGDESSTEDK